MRDYLFRGKPKDGGAWAYGSLTVEYDGTCFINYWVSELTEPENNFYEQVHYMPEVIPETIGIHIGWSDFNDTNVFTGDQIEIQWSDDKHDTTVEVISYDEYFGYFKFGNNPICELKDPIRKFTIIGNIHDVNQPTGGATHMTDPNVKTEEAQDDLKAAPAEQATEVEQAPAPTAGEALESAETEG